MVHIQTNLLNLCPAACCYNEADWYASGRIQTKYNDVAINAGLPAQFNSPGGPRCGRCTKRARLSCGDNDETAFALRSQTSCCSRRSNKDSNVFQRFGTNTAADYTILCHTTGDVIIIKSH